MLTLGILNPVWETVAHHQALIDSAVYPDVTKSIAQGAANIEFMYHVLPSRSTPEAALEAPVTEVLFWSLKEGTDREEFKRLENEFGAKVLPSDAVKNRGGFGSVVEDERKISVILGWDSVEVRLSPLIDGRKLTISRRILRRLSLLRGLASILGS